MIATTAQEILHRAIAEVFSLPGYAVTPRLVNAVDNQGEPCESCQLEGHVVDALVYGVVLGVHANLYECREACLHCVPAVIQLMDPTADITVEMASIDAEDNGRMAGPDDTRPHPDAL